MVHSIIFRGQAEMLRVDFTESNVPNPIVFFTVAVSSLQF